MDKNLEPQPSATRPSKNCQQMQSLVNDCQTVGWLSGNICIKSIKVSVQLDHNISKSLDSAKLNIKAIMSGSIIWGQTSYAVICTMSQMAPAYGIYVLVTFSITWSPSHLRKCSGHIRVCSGYEHVFFLDTIVWSSVVTIVSMPDIISHFWLVAFQRNISSYVDTCSNRNAYCHTSSTVVTFPEHAIINLFR